MAKIMVAAKSAIFEFEGKRVTVRKGVHTAREGHPIVKAHPELWTAQTLTYDTDTAEEKTPVQEDPKTAQRPAESATAAPGEHRTVGTAPASATSSAPTRRGRRGTGKTDGKESGE
jgi:hypothetical protein